MPGGGIRHAESGHRDGGSGHLPGIRAGAGIWVPARRGGRVLPGPGDRGGGRRNLHQRRSQERFGEHSGFVRPGEHGTDSRSGLSGVCGHQPHGRPAHRLYGGGGGQRIPAAARSGGESGYHLPMFPEQSHWGGLRAGRAAAVGGIRAGERGGDSVRRGV